MYLRQNKLWPQPARRDHIRSYSYEKGYGIIITRRTDYCIAKEILDFTHHEFIKITNPITLNVKLYIFNRDAGCHRSTRNSFMFHATSLERGYVA